MLSRFSVIAAVVFSTWFLPNAAWAGTTTCYFRGIDVSYEDREGYGHHAYYPVYEYYCWGGGVDRTDYLRLSDTKAFAGTRFQDAGSAWRWLFRNEEALAPLRASLVLDPGQREASVRPVFGQVVDMEVIGASAFQIGAVSLTLLPQFRVIKALRWMSEVSDARHVSRARKTARGATDRRNERWSSR